MKESAGTWRKFCWSLCPGGVHFSISGPWSLRQEVVRKERKELEESLAYQELIFPVPIAQSDLLDVRDFLALANEKSEKRTGVEAPVAATWLAAAALADPEFQPSFNKIAQAWTSWPWRDVVWCRFSTYISSLKKTSLTKSTRNLVFQKKLVPESVAKGSF